MSIGKKRLVIQLEPFEKPWIVVMVIVVKKRENFILEEEQQFACSFLHISQNPITRYGEKNSTFYDMVCTHYNKSWSPNCAKRPLQGS